MNYHSLVETFVSEANSRLLENFLFANADSLDIEDCERALRDAFNVLIGSFYLAHNSSDTPIIDTFIEKIGTIKGISSLKEDFICLHYLWEVYQQRLKLAKFDKPIWTFSSQAPWKLGLLLSIHLLHLASHIRPNLSETNLDFYLELFNSARGLAQRSQNMNSILRTSHDYLLPKWVEGLTYIWQGVIIPAESDTRLYYARQQILNHAKRILIGTIEQTSLRSLAGGSTDGNCLETISIVIIGALCELMNKPMEAIWWYHTFNAYNMTFSSEGLISELKEVLEAPSSPYQAVMKQAQQASIQFCQNNSYASIIERQARASPPVPMRQHTSGEDVPAGRRTHKAHILIDSGRHAGRPLHGTNPHSNANNDWKKSQLDHKQNSAIRSLSTMEYLGRSRRSLELSTALPSPGFAVPYEPVSQHAATKSVEPSTDTEPAVPPTQTTPSNTQPQPIEDAKTRLARRIELFGLEEHKQVPGDGNCQFSSLSDQLYGDFAHAEQIRGHVVQWLILNADLELENGAKLKDFGNDDEGWDHYCSLMALSGTWGDHLTLVAAAELFRVKILIVSSAVDDSQALIEIVPSIDKSADQEERMDVIFLCHYAEFHYGTLRVKIEDEDDE